MAKNACKINKKGHNVADFLIEVIIASKSILQGSKFIFFSKQWYLYQLCAIEIKDVIEKWKILVVKKKLKNSKKGHNLRNKVVGMTKLFSVLP